MTIQRGDLTHTPTEIVETSYKGVTLVAIEGNIVNRLSHVDAIVVPSSPDLTYQSGAIEKAVHDKFGDGPFNALKNKKKALAFSGDIASGEAVGVKDKGNTFIFVNIQPEGEDNYTQTPEGVELSAMSCFAEASSLGCKSIAMPALGNGMWNVELPVSAGAIGSAARSYIDAMEAQGKKQNLRRIEMVLYKPSLEQKKSIIEPIKLLARKT